MLGGTARMDPREIADRHRRRAEVALDLGRFRVAEREARAALGADPHLEEALVILCRAHLGEGDYEAALGAATSVVAASPRRGYGHFLLGFALQCLGRHAEAVEALRQAVSLDPSYARYHGRLALALAEAQSPEAAVVTIDQALTMAPRDGVVLEIAARVFGIVRDLPRAETAAREFVALEPENPGAFARLTWVLSEARKYDEAIGIAREAIRLDPNNFAVWANLGYAALEKHDLAQAEEATRQALRLKPGLVSATTNLVAILRERQAFAEAAEVLARAVAREPANAGWRQQLGEVRGVLAQRERLRWSDAVVLTLGSVTLAVIVALLNGWAGLALGFMLLALTAWLWRGRNVGRRDRNTG